VNRRWLLVLPVVLFLAAACGADDNETPSATATSAPAGPTLPPFPTRAPQPTATPVTTYAVGTRTDIEVVDGVLAALESGDPAALTAQLSFHPYRCDNAPTGTEGSNPCPPGVADGSPVDVVAAGGCDVTFLARDLASLDSEVADYARTAAEQGIYAVSEVQEGRLASPLPLRYLIILSGGYSLLLDDAGVTHLGLPCEGVGPAELYHPADRPILPPL
jgi:hypothetical protein